MQYQFKYRGTSAADASPHIFGMADQAYHAMLHQKKGQSIVITGESGAGKTESAKFLLQQLVYLGKVRTFHVFHYRTRTPSVFLKLCDVFSGPEPELGSKDSPSKPNHGGFWKC